MKYTFNYTQTGIKTGTEFKRKLMNALMLAASEVVPISENASIEDYKSKRKTKNTTSWIIDSFHYKINAGSTFMVKAVITANTPYIQYVNDGHTLRNGVWWNGYEFMEAGLGAAANVVVEITNKHLNNIR